MPGSKTLQGIEKNMNKYANLFILLLIWLLCAGSAAASPLLLGGSDSYPLAGHLEMLVDPGGKLTLADVVSPVTSDRFAPISGNLNRGYSGGAVWLRFTATRSALFPEDAWLRLGPSYIDYVTLFQQSGENPASPAAYRETRLGDHIPVADRPVSHPEFVAPVRLPSDRPTTFLIRIKSTSTLNLEGAFHTSGDMFRYNTSYFTLQGGYLGIALMISLVNLIYFLRIRDSIFLYFSLYVFGNFTMQSGVSGMVSLIWPSRAHLLSDYLVGVSLGGLVLVFSIFSIRLFSIDKSRWSYRYLLLTSAVSLLTMLAVPLGFYGVIVPFALLGSLGIIILMMWLSIGAVRNREPVGMLYLTAFGISNVAYTVQILRVLGMVPVVWWSLHAIQAATLVNMVMMTLALTERLRIAEERALESARNAEQNAVDLAGEMTVELRDEREKLKDALERQVRFVDMVSHEYRTPLAIIKSNLDLLRDRKDDAEIRDAGIDRMQRAVSRLVEVVETSFSVSRLSGLETSAAGEPIEVADFLAEVRDEAGGLWGAADFRMPPNSHELVFVLADRAQLKTAILNLIDNAVKYGGLGFPIDLGVESDRQQVRISVADQGPGFGDDSQESMRMRFRRGVSGEKVSGVGIGLYLVDRIVAEHGGRFEITGNIPRGTIAAIVFPRHNSDESSHFVTYCHNS